MSKNLLRLSQLVTSFGPGAMIDLPDWSVMIAGLERWEDQKRRAIVEPRLACRLPDGSMRGLATPPIHEESPYRNDAPGVDAIIFPRWFVTTHGERAGGSIRRKLVRFDELDQRSRALVEMVEGKRRRSTVAPVRFVAACERGHVQDIHWGLFVHRGATDCVGRLYLEETGATGDVAETWIRCECGARRPVYDALGAGNRVLGTCRGERPWLGPDAREDCDRPLRLLVRTASNAYFPVTVTVLSLPAETEEERVDLLVAEHREDLSEIQTAEDLTQAFRFNKRLREAFKGIDAEKIFAALERLRAKAPQRDTSRLRLKPEEFEVLAGPDQGARDDPRSVLVTERLDRALWDPDERYPVISALTLVHRLRVVTALRGFTRFDFPTPDKDGELDREIQVQDLSQAPKPYPAIEQRGEGVFVVFDRNAVERWAAREDVQERVATLERGFRRWAQDRRGDRVRFPGAAWIALHTLSHMLLAEIALEAGYPLTSLRERVYAAENGYGILLYAAAFDIGGTLGGLVALGRRLVEFLERARERFYICSSDPVCAEHNPCSEASAHPLAGAACFGCVLLPEPCCEARNDFLDRSIGIGTIKYPRLGILHA